MFDNVDKITLTIQIKLAAEYFINEVFVFQN